MANLSSKFILQSYRHARENPPIIGMQEKILQFSKGLDFSNMLILGGLLKNGLENSLKMSSNLWVQTFFI